MTLRGRVDQPAAALLDQLLMDLVVGQGNQVVTVRYLGEGGEWFNDEDADDYEPNEFGGMNRVIAATAASAPRRVVAGP